MPTNVRLDAAERATYTPRDRSRSVKDSTVPAQGDRSDLSLNASSRTAEVTSNHSRWRKPFATAFFAALVTIGPLAGGAAMAAEPAAPAQTTTPAATPAVQHKAKPKPAAVKAGLAQPKGVVAVPHPPLPRPAAPPKANGVAAPKGVVTVPDPRGGSDTDDKHAFTVGPLHVGGDVDDFDAKLSKGIDAGDWQSPLDNFQGGFVRGEFVRNFRINGYTMTTGDTDKGTFAGIELGGVRARSDNDVNLSGGFLANGFGNLNGDKGFNLQIEGDETIGVNLARGNVHNTQDLGNGWSNEVGARGYVNATAEYDAMYNWSSNSATTPNGFTGTTRLGVGGQSEGYDVLTHTDNNGTLTLEAHAGVAYNFAGQGVYGNRSNDRLNPTAHFVQSYQFKGGTLDGVTLGAREDWQQTSQGTFTRVAASAEKDVKVFDQDATVGVYAGHQQLGSQGSNFVGAGITFHF